MKSKLLFPFAAKIAGAVLFLPCCALLVLWLSYDLRFSWLQYRDLTTAQGLGNIFEDGNLTNEVILGGLLLSLILMAFSEEKTEDERTFAIRLGSLHLSHYINYAILALWLFGTQGLPFILCAVALPYLFLIVFLIIYNTRLYLLPRLLSA